MKITDYERSQIFINMDYNLMETSIQKYTKIMDSYKFSYHITFARLTYDFTFPTLIYLQVNTNTIILLTMYIIQYDSTLIRELFNNYIKLSFLVNSLLPFFVPRSSTKMTDFLNYLIDHNVETNCS